MSAAVALLVSLAVTPVVITALRRRQALDWPSERSSHCMPTLRGGGLAVGVGAVAGLLSENHLPSQALTGLMVASVLFAGIGLAEDLRGVPALPRLGAQLLAALVVLPWLLSDLDGSLAWRLTFALGVTLWLASYVNAFNFMDGINGISVAQVVVAGGAWWAIGHAHDAPGLAHAALVVALAALGFLPFNVPHAHVFLGDVGSYFLGAWLAVLVVVGLRAGIPVEAMFAPLSLYLADTGVTLLRRVRRRQTWHQPHRDHVYQRLHHGLGWSHVRTTAVVTTFLVACSLLGAVSLTPSFRARVAADLLLAALVGAYLRLPRALASRSQQLRPGVRESALA